MTKEDAAKLTSDDWFTLITKHQMTGQSRGK